MTGSQLVAIKTIAFKGDLSILDLCREEIKMLSRLEHIHIVKFIDHRISPDDATIVMEYCAQGDLKTLIDDAATNKSVPLRCEPRRCTD